MSHRWLLFLTVFILLGACSDEESATPEADQPAEETLYFPPVGGNEWSTLPPATLNWCPAKMDGLKAYLAANNTKAFIILKDGKIVAEWYYGDHTQSSPWYWASAGKSLTAFLIGLAQQEGALDISKSTNTYLKPNWTTAPDNKEAQITVRHQLSMTTGLNDDGIDLACTEPPCLKYLADAGDRWSYHNGPYTLLGDVLERATGSTRNEFTQQRLHAPTGMTGSWVNQGYNWVYFSTARSMARFGLLMLNKGKWDEKDVLQDKDYYQQMISPSQSYNPSYGYLWWLNGKGAHMLPGSQNRFDTDLIPNAPADMFAALGLNDQKLYVVPSQNLVIVRMGESAGFSNLASSSFDNELWEKLSNLSCE